ncbi:MAG TPA: phosphatidate cytidylyltransferase [Bacteroidales bacterium]|nr:phosphatidate cytidylyltransferase [Bacteroidales bacterium]
MKKIPALSSLPVRLASGAVFTGIVLACILISEYTLIALMAFFMFVLHHEFLKALYKKATPFAYIASLVISLSALVAVFIYSKTGTGNLLLSIPLLLFFAFPFLYILKNRQSGTAGLAVLMLSVIYFAIPLAMAVHIGFNEIPYAYSEYSGFKLMLVFMLIWSYDSFAYLTGCSIGRTKLMPAVSPKKSVEGVIGGTLLTIALALAGTFITEQISITDALVLPILVCAFGTAGDLFASWLKRSVDIKDFGNIMPGHGGMLDRLDSFLFVMPWAWAYFQFV